MWENILLLLGRKKNMPECLHDELGNSANWLMNQNGKDLVQQI